MVPASESDGDRPGRLHAWSCQSDSRPDLLQFPERKILKAVCAGPPCLLQECARNSIPFDFLLRAGIGHDERRLSVHETGVKRWDESRMPYLVNWATRRDECEK